LLFRRITLIFSDCSLAQYLLPEEGSIFEEKKESTPKSKKNLKRGANSSQPKSNPEVEAKRDDARPSNDTNSVADATATIAHLGGNPRIKLKRKFDESTPPPLNTTMTTSATSNSNQSVKKIAHSSSASTPSAPLSSTTSIFPPLQQSPHCPNAVDRAPPLYSRTLCRFLVDHFLEYLASPALLHCIVCYSSCLFCFVLFVLVLFSRTSSIYFTSLSPNRRQPHSPPTRLTTAKTTATILLRNPTRRIPERPIRFRQFMRSLAI
jgi:hypothetical protein